MTTRWIPAEVVEALAKEWEECGARSPGWGGPSWAAAAAALRALLASPEATTGTDDSLTALDKRICSFGARINLGDGGELHLHGEPSHTWMIPARWEVRWRRGYEGVASDWREVSAESLPEALDAAESWEDDNDAAEPQPAPALSPSIATRLGPHCTEGDEEISNAAVNACKEIER
jgi:hypothetical protein